MYSSYPTFEKFYTYSFRTIRLSILFHMKHKFIIHRKNRFMIVYKTWKSQLRICLIIWTPFPFLLFDMSLFTTFTTTHLYCLLLCKLSISLQIEWKCTSCWWRRKWMLSCSDSVALYLIDSWSIFSLNICLYLSHDFFTFFGTNEKCET